MDKILNELSQIKVNKPQDEREAKRNKEIE
jgi:hypothetical protein